MNTIKFTPITETHHSQQAVLNAVIDQCALLKAALANMINIAEARVEVASQAAGQINQLDLAGSIVELNKTDATCDNPPPITACTVSVDSVDSTDSTDAKDQAIAASLSAAKALLTAHVEVFNVPRLNEQYNQLLGAYRAITNLEALATNTSHS